MLDAIIIGSGLGGLLCGARLARNGLKVLILEKNPHSGGTSAIFRRRGFAFPMGPLAFSHPARVSEYLSEAGVAGGLSYHRDHYQFVASGWDIIVSRPLGELKAELQGLFPAEARGLGRFFQELEREIGLITRLEDRLPDHARTRPPRGGEPEAAGRIDEVRRAGRTACGRALDRWLGDEALKRFLGGMGTSPPTMSWLNLAVMWNLMSEVGIWSPAGGIHGLGDRLREVFGGAGGTIRLSTPVTDIIVEKGRAVGVVTGEGREFRSRWVVSNADAKTTFLSMLAPSELPADFRRMILETPYTGSEFCVYAGIDPARVDFSRMKAPHLLWTPEEAAGERPGAGDFARRGIEICRWSETNPGHCPPGREALVFRSAFPYEEFAEWKTGYRERKPGYREMKQAKALALLRSVESVLPGLSAAVEVMETATPLTYEDWGNRFRGSIAGWSWGPDKEGFGSAFLVETPIDDLLLAGLYASTELLFGGVPTSLFCARAAAERILAN